MLWHTRNEPGGASDIAGLPANGVDTAVDDIVDKSGVDIDTVEQFHDGSSTKVGRMHIGQTAATTTDGGADGFDDVGLSHGNSSELRSDRANGLAEAIRPPSGPIRDKSKVGFRNGLSPKAVELARNQRQSARGEFARRSLNVGPCRRMG